MACRAVCCRTPKRSAAPVLYNVKGLQGDPVPLDGLPEGFQLGSAFGSGISTDGNLIWMKIIGK